jgi:outer membrane protein OmpA-like peptidoglycan-associated protein
VHFLGVGNAAAGWPDIKTPQRTWIVALWKALCDATRAKCDEPDSAKPGTVEAAGVELPEDSDVAMPAISVKKDNPMVLSVPSSLLFDTDSYLLAPGRSQDSLQQVYDYLKPLRPKRIEVNGHTDSRGTPEHNLTLSRNRAEAVAAKLRGQQFTNITTHGFAADRLKCKPEYRNGAADLVAMACNRRVEIVVYT